MGIVSEIKLIGAELYDGETYRGDCPVCNRTGVFTVSRDGDSLVWNCYRASCDSRGRIGERASRSLLTRENPKKQSTTPFTGELEELNEDWRQYLKDRIGWEGTHLDIGRPMYAPSERRVAYPIYGPMGVRRGWVLRSYAPSIDPRWKALTRMDVAEPHMSWYRSSPSDNRVLVVEDIPSAVRAAVYWPQVVAMCGGGIGPDYVGEIAAFVRNVTWAFDPDATVSALRHHRKYGIFFDSSRVLPLEADLKDMEEEALSDLMKEVL